jgi:hypothetical protein
MSKLRPPTKPRPPWYGGLVKAAVAAAGFAGAVALFIHNIDDIAAFAQRMLGRGDPHLAIINSNAQMATDSTFAQVFVESRPAFLSIPADKRYYQVTFYITKEPGIASKDCKVIVDGDDMNPLVTNGNIGDLSAAEATQFVSFRLRSRDDDPESRKIYVKCKDAVSQAVAVALR